MLFVAVDIAAGQVMTTWLIPSPDYAAALGEPNARGIFRFSASMRPDAADRAGPALLVDPLTDTPVVAIYERRLQAAVPSRLPAQSALAAVILDNDVCWLRTADGNLYLPAMDSSLGLRWGYPGTGPGARVDGAAELVDRGGEREGGPGLLHTTQRSLVVRGRSRRCLRGGDRGCVHRTDRR